MKLKDIKLNDLVSVNTHPEGEIYVVSEIHGFNVHLTQTIKGDVFSSGWIDYSCIKKPLKTQLARHIQLYK